MPLVEDPEEVIVCDLDRCSRCGGDLTGAPVSGKINRSSW